jgi:transposase
LEESFCLAQQKQFGASSEGHPGQGALFNEAEAFCSKEYSDDLSLGEYVPVEPLRNLLILLDVVMGFCCISLEK